MFKAVKQQSNLDKSTDKTRSTIAQVSGEENGGGEKMKNLTGSTTGWTIHKNTEDTENNDRIRDGKNTVSQEVKPSGSQ